MKLTLQGHEDLYAVEQLMMVLLPQREGTVVSAVHRGKKWISAVTKVTIGQQSTRAVRRIPVEKETVRLRRQALQQSLYKAALPHLTQLPPWGALAGVRPTKLPTRHLLQGGTRKSADAMLKNVYFVTENRRALALSCSEATVAAAKLLTESDLSLYIGIPFCPSRCTYCSFVSRCVGKRTELIEPYLQALQQEIALTGQLLKQSGKTIRSLYIGGGTPTTLSAAQLAQLMESVRRNFDLSRCLEFTVEGGRPDTLNLEKLQLLRKLGADRMSINPQTMCDQVLCACGRPHTAEDVLRSYEQAVQAGFENINMDLIAGLPQDHYDGFCRSLQQVMELHPSNITVHTLALKKGADLFEKREALPDDAQVARMVDYANAQLSAGGYRPYYLYRQKYMSGSFENVGWSRDNTPCLYNIYMMEELHTILSLGGGAMNKLNFPDGSLQRFHNPKFPEQYIEQLPQVLEQKQELFALMKGSI